VGHICVFIDDLINFMNFKKNLDLNPLSSYFHHYIYRTKQIKIHSIKNSGDLLIVHVKSIKLILLTPF